MSFTTTAPFRRCLALAPAGRLMVSTQIRTGTRRCTSEAPAHRPDTKKDSHLALGHSSKYLTRQGSSHPAAAHHQVTREPTSSTRDTFRIRVATEASSQNLSESGSPSTASGHRVKTCQSSESLEIASLNLSSANSKHHWRFMGLGNHFRLG